ncbi:MAG: hypothetical protein O7C75_20975 [Verrucomicrobia bacterium]|nr:hypothetical protein [Verrucomicrobiota bacterium]
MKLLILAVLLTSVGCSTLPALVENSDAVRDSSQNSPEVFDKEKGEGDLKFILINESDKFRVEAPDAKQKEAFTLLSLRLKRINTTRVPFWSHDHVEVFDKKEELISSLIQYIRHRHYISRYLGHRHRTIFVPERISVNRSNISKIKITSHVGHQELN